MSGCLPGSLGYWDLGNGESHIDVLEYTGIDATDSYK